MTFGYNPVSGSVRFGHDEHLGYTVDGAPLDPPLDAATLLIVAGLLRRLVRDEYPADLRLSDIAATWGDANPDELAALRAYEEIVP